MTGRRAELIRLLTSYRPRDADERRYQAEMLDLAAAAHDPFDRHAYQPGHFTASGFVLHPDGEQVLLIHHAKLGIWVQPGGHIDPGDGDLVESARREIAEETGLDDLEAMTDGLVDIDVHVFPEGSGQPRHHHYDLRFGFVTRFADLKTNDEVRAARWVRADGLDGLEVDRSVTRPIGRLLGGI